MKTLHKLDKDPLPTLCETCLTRNPFVKMLRVQFGADCKVCLKPYTVFRWQNDGSQFNATKICTQCSKLKHLCQSCLLDLDLEISPKTRDSALNIKNTVPKQAGNRDYFIENTSKSVKNSILLEQSIKDKYEDLKQLKANEPDPTMKPKQVCSFFAKGECKRGEYCPFSHELSSSRPLSLKHIQNFYFGEE